MSGSTVTGESVNVELMNGKTLTSEDIVDLLYYHHLIL